MSMLCTEPLIHHFSVEETSKLCGQGPRRLVAPSGCSPYYRRPERSGFHGRRLFCDFKPPLRPLSRRFRPSCAGSKSSSLTTVVGESSSVVFKETFALKQTSMIEGKISVRLDHDKDEKNWKLIVGCDLPGKWLLHWGVSYINDVGNEWDQPPKEMIPPESIYIRDYAIETPMKNSSSSHETDSFQEVAIDFDPKSSIAAIHFVLKDELTGAWYQHKGRDFKVPLVKYLQGDGYVVGLKKAFSKLAVPLGTLSSMFLKLEAPDSEDEDSSSNNAEFNGLRQDIMPVVGFNEEFPIAKGVEIMNSVTVSVRKCSDTGESLVSMETDLLGDVVIHWGVCRDETRKWEVPKSPLPTHTVKFKRKALRTLLNAKEDGTGSCGLFTIENGYEGFLFVLKQNESPWLSYMGDDFCVPLPISSVSTSPVETAEIEQLASEAYSMFRSSNGTMPLEEEEATKVEESKPQLPAVTSSGTGSGFEILVQGFNWESHKSRGWYKEIKAKAEELASLGFSVIWLPPPTESVSPEGYMPKDLYNLDSRYGTMDELKEVVKNFHKVGMKVLGDVVLNHRCAHYQNQNGVWNIFGGHLNWDDRAIVSDDPHFQGRGNKSSGDNFHAAPNIDHSQDFVRKDIKEWLCYLRKVIGYDGWRLDFVRGFWGGYVKDYLEASGPYFAVGEYWDSLSYTYDTMDHNQDPHRQRIVDWINATNGAAGAFDVTTKGILHAALERCEYWRLSDGKGNPPGVLGWWPSRAVTFIENHDTGSTQGHWRFPGGKEMQGYAYILTHPGTPSVFYDHIFSQYRDEIASLINLRKMRKLNCRSKVKITKAERDVYAAVIDDRVAVKIGPGHHQPVSDDSHVWALALEGREYKVWITV